MKLKIWNVLNRLMELNKDDFNEDYESTNNIEDGNEEDLISKVEEEIDKILNVMEDGYDEEEEYIPEFAVEDTEAPEEKVHLSQEEQEEYSIKYQPLFKSVIAMYTEGGGNNDCVDDIVSAASLGFTMALKNYDKSMEKNGISQFAAFCRTCMVNQIKTDISKYAKIKNNTVSFENKASKDSEILLAEVIPAKDASSQDYVEKKEMLAALRSAVNSELNSIERLVICSTYGAFGYKELSQQQISSMLVKLGAYQKISQAAISKQKKVIMSKLRVALVSKYKVTHY